MNRQSIHVGAKRDDRAFVFPFKSPTTPYPPIPVLTLMPLCLKTLATKAEVFFSIPESSGFLWICLRHAMSSFN